MYVNYLIKARTIYCKKKCTFQKTILENYLKIESTPKSDFATNGTNKCRIIIFVMQTEMF